MVCLSVKQHTTAAGEFKDEPRRGRTTSLWRAKCFVYGGTPKRSLSVPSGPTEYLDRSTVKRVWPCHPGWLPLSCRAICGTLLFDLCVHRIPLFACVAILCYKG